MFSAPLPAKTTERFGFPILYNSANTRDHCERVENSNTTTSTQHQQSVHDGIQGSHCLPRVHSLALITLPSQFGLTRWMVVTFMVRMLGHVDVYDGC